MVKGISRQVIVVQGAEPKLFEQAIFILKDEAIEEGITDEVLLKEAQEAIRGGCGPDKKQYVCFLGAVCAAGGALLTALLWLLTALF